jgi:hypothetical protein
MMRDLLYLAAAFLLFGLLGLIIGILEEPAGRLLTAARRRLAALRSGSPAFDLLSRAVVFLVSFVLLVLMGFCFVSS